MRRALVIQGKIDDSCLSRTLNEYVGKFDEIVLSTYQEDISSTKVDVSCCRLVVNQQAISSGVHNAQNMYRQAMTTLNGARSCQSLYCIKMRADEFYTGLDKLPTDPNKILNNNVFLSPNIDYHMGDHIIGASREIMVKAMQNLISLCESNDSSVRVFVEIAIMKSFMFALGKDTSMPWKDVLANVIDIAYIDDLEPLVIKYNSNRKSYKSAEEYYKCPSAGGDTKWRGVIRKPSEENG